MALLPSSFTAVVATALCLAAEGNTWTQLSPSNPPPGIGRSAMVWDEVGDGAFLFGGEAMPSYNKINVLYFYSKSLNAWSVKSSTGAPAARHMHTAVLRTPQRMLYVFAGGTRDIHSSATGQLFSDLFGYDVAADSWTQLTSHATPRALHTAVWDTASDRMIIYGGEADDSSKTKLGDVLEYDPGSDTWSSPTVTTEPNARSGHVAVWDVTSAVMLMCCGHGDVSVYNPFVSSSEQHYNDLWSYSNSAGWVELVDFGSFTPRRELAAVWDANTRSLLAYGGRFTSGELDSMFYYSSTTDSSYQETVAGPGARDAHCAAWNPDSAEMYMIGGWTGSGFDDVLWKFTSTLTSITTTSTASTATSTTSSSTTWTRSSSSTTTGSITSTSSSTSETATISSTSTSSSTTSSSSSTSSGTTSASSSTSTSSTSRSSSQTSSSSSTSSTATSTRSNTESSSSSTSTSTSSSRTSSSSSSTSSSGSVSGTGTTSTSSSASETTGPTSTSSSTPEMGSTSTSSSASASISSSTSSTRTLSSSSTASARGSSVTISTTTITSSVTSTSVIRTQSFTSTSSATTSISTSPGPAASGIPSLVASDQDALDAVEQAEQSAVLEVMATLDLNTSDLDGASGVLGNATWQSPVASVMAWALAPNSQGPLILDAGHLSVVLVPEVLAQASQSAQETAQAPSLPVVLTVGFSNNRSILLNSTGLLASPAVSVNFRTPSGQPLSLKALVKPVELKFEGSQELSRARCKWWDEEAKVWSEDGVRRSSRFEDADEFVCLTSHLTIFGAVLEAVLQVLQCSTASEVLSVDGLQNLGNAQWLHYAASIVTFVSLSFFAGAMIWAMRRDCRTAEDLPFEEVAEALLVSRREVESSGLEPHVEEVEGLEPDAQAAANRRCCPRCRACAMKGLDGAVWLLSTMFEVQATDSVSELLDVKMAMVNRCITSIHSYRTGACRQSIRTVMASSGEKKLRRPSTRGGDVTHTRTTSSVVSAMETWKVHYHGVTAVERFLHGSWLRRVIILLPCMHPWLTASLRSLFRSHTVRVALIVLKLVSAAFTNALFFASTAQSPDSDEECAAAETLEEHLLTATIVGFLSACAGDVLIVLLALIQRRSVLVRDVWTPKMKSRQLVRWRWRQRFFWFIWLAIAGFSAFYTLTFLANVSAADAAKWLESTGMSALQDLVFKPVLLAVGYATLSTLVLLCNPRVKDTVTDRWIHPDEVEDRFVTDIPSLSFLDRDDTASAGSESDGSMQAAYF